MMAYEQQIKDQKQAYAYIHAAMQAFVKYQYQACRAFSDLAREAAALQGSNACPPTLKDPFQQLAQFCSEFARSAIDVVEAVASEAACFALDFKPLLQTCANARKAYVPFIQDSNRAVVESALQFERQRLYSVKQSSIALGRAFCRFGAVVCEQSGALEVAGRLLYEDDARLAVANQFQGVELGADVYALCGVHVRQYRSGKQQALTESVQAHGKSHKSKSKTQGTPREVPVQAFAERSSPYRLIDYEDEYRLAEQRRQFVYDQNGAAKAFPMPCGEAKTLEESSLANVYNDYPEFRPQYEPKSLSCPIAADQTGGFSQRIEKYADDILFYPRAAAGRLLSVYEIDYQLAYLRYLEGNIKAVGSPQPAITAYGLLPQVSALEQRNSLISPQASQKAAGFSPGAVFSAQQPASYFVQEAAQAQPPPEQQIRPAEPALKQQEQPPQVELAAKKKRLIAKQKEVEAIRLDFDAQDTGARPDAKQKQKKLPQVDLDNLL